MREKTGSAETDEVRDEYDFESMGPPQRRGYAERVREARDRRLLDPELAKEFPDDAAVNQALRDYLSMKRKSA